MQKSLLFTLCFLSDASVDVPYCLMELAFLFKLTQSLNGSIFSLNICCVLVSDKRNWKICERMSFLWELCFINLHFGLTVFTKTWTLYQLFFVLLFLYTGRELVWCTRASLSLVDCSHAGMIWLHSSLQSKQPEVWSNYLDPWKKVLHNVLLVKTQLFVTILSSMSFSQTLSPKQLLICLYTDKPVCKLSRVYG